ncbi:MAG: esterase [Mycobacterium sp.]|jgi:acetyl esterase/lipase|nr:esterase [Mycobacterium sp.]
MDSRYPVTGGQSRQSRARWFVRATPFDYLLAITDAYASLPLVGKHFEPIGGIAAISVWGYRNAPDFISSVIRNMTASRATDVRKQERDQTNSVAAAALRGAVSAERLDVVWPAPDRVAPLLRGPAQRRRYLHRSAVRYGSAPGQVLDVWRRKDLPPGPAPVLVFVPGGAWVHGSRMLQGYALLAQLAEQGWVCLSIDYRVSPHHRWPRQVRDVKAAVAWARANADRFGGDREFVAIAGCSAGGHLAALTGLTPDDPDFHGELPPDADTSVEAVVGIYGRYDWEDRSTPERDRFVDFIERIVVRKRYARHRDVYRNASPIARVRPDAPPFLVVHGTADTVIPVEQAQMFVERLRAGSLSTVAYLELPGAHHGFDMTDGCRTRTAAMAVGLFLDEIHRSRLLARAKRVI